MNHYILKGKTPVLCDDNKTLSEWFSLAQNRIVKKTTLGDVQISTAFLVFDHSSGFGEPVLFETMVFGGEFNEYQERYCTYEQAEKGHQKAIDMVKKSIYMLNR